MAAGHLFIAALAADGDVASLLEQGAIGHLFNTIEADTWTFVEKHVRKHGAIPKAETIEKHTGVELPHAVEPPSYYLDVMQQSFIERELKNAWKETSEKLGATAADKDPEAALQLMTDAVRRINLSKSRKMISDFREAHTSVVGDYIAKMKQPAAHGLRFGWPSIDNAGGAGGIGEMTSMVGRPAQGKTWQMLWTCLHGWLETAKLHVKDPDVIPQSRLFVSMEMAKLPIEQRLAAIVASIPMTKLDKAELSTVYVNKLKLELTKIAGMPAPFWILDGNLASTVDELWSVISILKPAGTWIDGGYLLKHPTEKDRFKRVAENAEGIKAHLCPLSPTVVSWQFSRPAKKAAKSKSGGNDNMPNMDDIGYTDAIAQVSGVAMGLFEPESVETINQRRVRVLKGRKGQIGEFSTEWDFKQMRFGEIVDKPVTELQYV